MEQQEYDGIAWQDGKLSLLALWRDNQLTISIHDSATGTPEMEVRLPRKEAIALTNWLMWKTALRKSDLAQ